MEGDRRMCQNTSFRLGGSRAKMGRQSPDTALPVCKSPGIFKKNAPPRRTPVFDLVSSIVRVTNVSPRLVGNDSERGDKSPPLRGGRRRKLAIVENCTRVGRKGIMEITGGVEGSLFGMSEATIGCCVLEFVQL